MKLLLLAIALFIASLTSFAQAPAGQYEQAMTEALVQFKPMNEKTPVADVLALANRFERIAEAEPTQWLAPYYAALCYSYLGYMNSDLADKDRALDKAAEWGSVAAKRTPDNDELHVLNAQIAQARLVVDPMNRWQTYGPMFQTELEKAGKLNADNPRIYVLQGSSLYYTPESFGGGTKAACPVLVKANEKFATFKPISNLHPTWGKVGTDGLLVNCK